MREEETGRRGEAEVVASHCVRDFSFIVLAVLEYVTLGDHF